MKYSFICLLLLFCIPISTHAAIVINEVAWMGTEVSANDEWIELYNNGNESVNVDGWSLRDGVNLSIELAGSIAAGHYAVLERTDDSSAPGSAFLLYAGALTNAGATLSLYTTDGVLEDRVVGGEDWVDIGGDNSTNETAQRTVSGWVTAMSTPGKSNATVGTEPAVEAIGTTSGASTAVTSVSSQWNHDASSPQVSTLYTTPRILQLDITAPDTVYVNQKVPLNNAVQGLSSPVLSSLVYTWNFGDLSVGTGPEVIHRFAYPGEYVITLHAKYKKYEAYARKTVIVLPVSFSLTTNTSGDIQVHNTARYEVDVSGYVISAQKTVLFPKATILRPKATITIPKERIPHAYGALLFDDTGIQLATLEPFASDTGGTSDLPAVGMPPASPPIVYAPLIEVPQVLSSVPTMFVPAPTQALDTQPAQESSFTFTSDPDNTVTPTTIDATPPVLPSTQIATPIEASKSIPNSKLPYLGLLAVIGIGMAAVFAGRVK